MTFEEDGVELSEASEVDIFYDSIEKMMELIISRESSIYIVEGCNTVKDFSGVSGGIFFPALQISRIYLYSSKKSGWLSSCTADTGTVFKFFMLAYMPSGT